MISVLVVDDQELVRTGFRLILDAEPDLHVAGEAADGRHAIDQATRLRPDVVLMDVRMPLLDGIAATRAILAQPPAPKIIMLTTFDVDEFVYGALSTGASGFLLKDVKAAHLADAIRTVHQGDALLAPAITRRLIARFVATQPPTQRRPDQLASLTAREREVLLMIARGLSNTEIAATLVVSETTIKTHIGRIFAKLGIRDRAQAVIAAYETGLVTPATPSP
ncbi:MAG TPA: response regulator transcription factor [Jatrophihabitantaceae bacterium]